MTANGLLVEHFLESLWLPRFSCCSHVIARLYRTLNGQPPGGKPLGNLLPNYVPLVELDI